MDRRDFLHLSGKAAAGAVAAVALPTALVGAKPYIFHRSAIVESSGNTLLTPSQVSREALALLKHHMVYRGRHAR